MMLLTLAVAVLAADLSQQTTQIALVLATIFTAITPLLLKFLPWDGKQMAAASYVVAFVIAIMAGLLSGELQLDTSSAQAFVTGLLVPLLATSGWLWTVQQLTFHALSDKPPSHPLAVH